MTPEKIGRYEVKSELGRGGMATVFEAYDPTFERMVAIKVLPREFLHETEFRARFEREAKTVASLEHPAIVPVYDFGEDNGQPYLVMRYMPGGSLADRLKQGPIPIEDAAVILKRLGSALDHAHEKGVIHRDLKPGNILFDQYGDAYLADFGIVHVTASTEALTASGSLVGTPMYMSPEQVYGDKELDGRSDVYALGVILFQMLTGELPYTGDTPARVMMKHVMDPIPPILEKRPDLPRDTDVVIHKALAKERDERFSSATDLSEALSKATREIPRPDLSILESKEETFVSPTPPPIEQKPVSSPIPAQPVGKQELPAPPPPPKSGPVPVFVPEEEPISASFDSNAGRRIPIWVIGLVGVLGLLCLGGLGAGIWLVTQSDLLSKPTPTWPGVVAAAEGGTDTATAVPPTSQADPGTSTAIAAARVATATAQAQPTLTITAIATAPAVNGDATAESVLATRAALAAGSADATATARAAATQNNSPIPLFGPVDGELVHDEDDLVESSYVDPSPRNFILRTTFITPYGSEDGRWDAGVTFRQSGPDDEFRLVVRSDGLWNLNNRQGDTDSFIGEGDMLSLLDLSPGGANELMLVAVDDAGYFFINNHLVSFLDLASRTNAGDLALGTGFYSADEHPGAVTAFTNLTVWPATPIYGPRSNQLEHVDDGLIKVRSANVDQANFIVDTIFENPYPLSISSWDIGYSFRETEFDDQMWLVIDSDGGWVLIDRQAGEDVVVNEGFVDNLDVSDSGLNHLTLIASFDRGFFLLNGVFVAELDLSSRPAAGDLAVMTAFYVEDEVFGETTKYEDFTIWGLP